MEAGERVGLWRGGGRCWAEPREMRRRSQRGCGVEEAWQCGGGQQAGAGLAGVTDAGVVAGTEGVPGAKPPAVTRRACFWVAAREDKSGEVRTQGQTMNREWLGCAGVSRYVSALDEALWECAARRKPRYICF